MWKEDWFESDPRHQYKYTMRWYELFERAIPETSYGYWITNTGEYISVDYHNHSGAASKHGTTYGRAIEDGWIRIVLWSSESIGINYNLGAIGNRAVLALKALMDDMPELKLYTVEVRGRASMSKQCDSQRDAMNLISRTTKAAVSQYDNDDWKWITLQRGFS